MAPAYGAAFGGIDNDQPEIKARQRHRARLDPKPRYPSKDFHHKEIAKKLRDGFRGLREKRKEPIHNFKGNTEGNSYVPVDLYFKCSGRAALNFFFRVGDSSCGCTHGAPPAASDAAADALV